jgi:hypothetical protein
MNKKNKNKVEFAKTAVVAVFCAIVIAGIVGVKMSQNIRAEAEKHLVVETGISAAVNRQIISQREGLENLKKEREQAQADRVFNRSLGN